jgi:DNA-binding NarL/FixJ family response regulator
MIRILIADDHAIVRKGLKQIISDTPDLVVADEACNGHETLDKIKQGDLDIVILDITMPGLSGLDILKEVKKIKPDLQVLILSMHPEEQYALRVLKSGAAGYMTKESAPEDLVSAVKKISEGGKYITPSLAEKIASHLEKDVEKPLHESLSDREYEVLCMIGRGKTVSEIAKQLYLSVKTVSTYRTRILEKTHLRNNAELIHYALKHDLVD